MTLGLNNTLGLVAQSQKLRQLVGQFVVDDDLARRFVSDPSGTLAGLGVELQSDEIRTLTEVLLAFQNSNWPNHEAIMELTDGADKVIK
jgi:hypothetical protein